jgi:hypothetical protein
MSEQTQRIVNSLTEGVAARGMRFFLQAALAAALLSGYAVARFRGLSDPQAMELAQLARGMAEGRGFATHCLRPLDLALLRDVRGAAPQPDACPDTRHAPALPALAAAGFKFLRPSFEAPLAGSLFQPETRVLVPLGILLTLLTTALINLTARRLFDPLVAWLASAAYLVTDGVMSDAMSGTALPLMTALGAAAVYAAVLSVQSRIDRRPVLAWLGLLAGAAALAGTAMLAGYSMWTLVAVVALFGASGGPRGRLGTCLLVIALAAGVVTPWLWRNVTQTGHLFGTALYGLLHETALYPGTTVDGLTEPSFHNVLVSLALRAKAFTGLTNAYGSLANAWGSGPLLALFAASFVHVFRRREANQLRWWGGAGLLLMLGVAVLGPRGSGAALRVYLPLAAVFGAAFFWDLTDRILIEDAWKTAASWLFVLLAGLPALLNATVTGPASPYPPYYPPFIAYAGGLLEPQEVMATDVPWATAWYAGRASVALPATPAELETMSASWHPVAAVYLTPATTDRPYARDLVDGDWRAWAPLIDGRIPEGFPLRYAIRLPPDSASQIFYSDRIRWKEAPAALAEEIDSGFRLRPEEKR